ncbi:MAG: sugar transferase [Syntrophobacteraceae bacterium]|jgi:exopolysaccharide biosynthesis polyprenyl glycosylphosphotransferase
MSEENKTQVQISIIFDIILTGIAYLIAHVCKTEYLPTPYRGLYNASDYSVIILLVIIIWFVSLQYSTMHIYYFRKTPFFTLLLKVTQLVTINLVILAFSFYIFRIADISRLMIGIFYIVNIFLLTLSRWLFNYILRLLRRNKPALRNVLVVVGSKQAAKDLISAIQGDPEGSVKILGCLDLDSETVGEDVTGGVKVIGTLEQLQNILATQVVDEVTFVMPVDMIWDAEKYFHIAESVGVQIRVVPHWHLRKFLASRPLYYSMNYEYFFQTPTFVLSATPKYLVTFPIKKAFDYLLAGTTLNLLAPLFLMIACAIKMCSSGPVFFKQVRVGLNGRKFIVYKFRTMLVNAEAMLPDLRNLNEADGVVFKIKNDPRIIPRIGTFLRKTSLDELPQLINVLRGEMSMVGPRPPLPEEVAEYKDGERRRLSMKPGITCIWQSQQRRNEIPFEKWMELDLEYIDNWSLWLDFKILSKTVVTVILGRGR